MEIGYKKVKYKKVATNHTASKVAIGFKLRVEQNSNVDDRLKSKPLADHSLYLNTMPI